MEYCFIFITFGQTSGITSCYSVNTHLLHYHLKVCRKMLLHPVVMARKHGMNRSQVPLDFHWNFEEISVGNQAHKQPILLFMFMKINLEPNKGCNAIILQVLKEYNMHRTWNPLNHGDLVKYQGTSPLLGAVYLTTSRVPRRIIYLESVCNKFILHPYPKWIIITSYRLIKQ